MKYYIVTFLSFINIYNIVKSIKVSQINKDLVNKPYNDEAKPYPFLFMPPTSPNDLNMALNTNIAPPSLSRALFETNPKRKLKLTEFLDEIRYPLYNMTRGETEQMFYFIDESKDDLIDQKEYDNFATFYVYPFEACDYDHNYVLNITEFKDCYDADPYFQYIRYPPHKDNDKYLILMDALTTRAALLLNFADYLLLKRATFGWKQCQSSSSYISFDMFSCAMRTALPIKYHSNLDLREFYNSGIRISPDQQSLIQMDFPIYISTFYFSYVFLIFSQSRDTPFLIKNDFIKSIREDRIPNNFSEDDVNILYDLINNNPMKLVVEMNVESWFFFFLMHRLFNKYSIERPLQITNVELIQLLDDKWFPIMMRQSIDQSLSNFTSTVYQEAGLIVDRERNEESLYYYKFSQRQDATALSGNYWGMYYSANKTQAGIDHTYYKVNENENARKIFFSLPSRDINLWNRQIYFRTMQLTNFYSKLTRDRTYLVPVTMFHEKIFEAYDRINPPLNLIQRTNYLKYRAIPKMLRIDLLVFLSVELWEIKLKGIRQSNIRYVDETDLKAIMSDFGMINIPDKLIDLNRTGYNSLRSREYNPKETFSMLSAVQAAAGELQRIQVKTQMYNIPDNKAWDRKYSNWPRRNTETIRAF